MIILIKQESNAYGEAMIVIEREEVISLPREIVQKPKEKGGLGVLNLRLQNNALPMKHLSKFYNRVDIP